MALPTGCLGLDPGLRGLSSARADSARAVARLLDLLHSETATPRELATVVEADQALAARVLRATNSAFYGPRGGVTTISRAVMSLGWQRIESLAIAVGVWRSILPDRGPELRRSPTTTTRPSQGSQAYPASWRSLKLGLHILRKWEMGFLACRPGPPAGWPWADRPTIRTNSKPRSPRLPNLLNRCLIKVDHEARPSATS